MSTAVHEHVQSPGRAPAKPLPGDLENDENFSPNTSAEESTAQSGSDQSGLKQQLRALGSLLYDLMRGKRSSGLEKQKQMGNANDDDEFIGADRHDVQSWHGNYYQSNPTSKDPSMYSVCPENCDEWLFIDDDDDPFAPPSYK